MTADSTDIKFACPQCGQSISVDASGAGLHANCPTCQHPLVIPSRGSLHDRSYGEAAPPAGRMAFAGEDAAIAAAELQERRAELAAVQRRSDESERALAAAEKENARLQQQLKQARDEGGQHASVAAEVPGLQAERQQLQSELAGSEHHAAVATAEVSALQAGRQQLQSELARSEHRAAAAETQLEEARAVISKLGAQLVAVEENRAQWEQAFAQTTEQTDASERQIAAQTADLNTALATARSEIETLTGEGAALRQQLESAQAEARAAAAAAEEKLTAARRQLQSAEAEHLSLTDRYATVRVEAATLRHDLSEIHSGRELLALRERFNALETDHLRITGAHARSTNELDDLTAAAEQLRADLAEARERGADAERRAEAASDSALKRDNDVLRGIVERQNAVGAESFAELRRLRRARLSLRILYGFITLGVLGLAALAIQYLPAAAKHFLHDWFGL